MTTDDRVITLLAALVSNTNRIAQSLELMTMQNAKEPNYQRPIEQYRDFDFETIGAQVKARDEHGVTALDWGGFIWTRRSPQNKFGEAIWFSRPLGKKEDGSVDYARLITFRKFTEAEPLPRKVEAIVDQAPRKKDTGPLPTTPATGANQSSGVEHLPEKKTNAPSYCRLHLADMTANAIGVFAHSVGDGGLCNGTASLPDTPDRCDLHVVAMTEQSGTGVLFHRIKDADGKTISYCDGTTVKPNGKH